jgi:hypothetical protein
MNVTGPQLKVVARSFKSFRTLDYSDAAPILLTDFTYKTFPRLPGADGQTEEEILALLGPMFAKVVKLEVRTKHPGTPFELPWMKFATLAQLP